MHPPILSHFHQHLATEFLKSYPIHLGWQSADPGTLHKAGYDLLLVRKNGRVTEKIVGFWLPQMPPTPSSIQQFNILVRKSAGRYAKISAKYLISDTDHPSDEPLGGFLYRKCAPSQGN